MPSMPYLGMPYVPSQENALTVLQSMISQSQGLFAVPTQIILVVAPINAILNYLLGIKASLLT